MSCPDKEKPSVRPIGDPGTEIPQTPIKKDQPIPVIQAPGRGSGRTIIVIGQSSLDVAMCQIIRDKLGYREGMGMDGQPMNMFPPEKSSLDKLVELDTKIQSRMPEDINSVDIFKDL